MGRPSLGQAARTVAASTKITRAEAQALTDADGSLYRGLRRAIEHYLAALAAPEQTVQFGTNEPEPAPEPMAQPDIVLSETEPPAQRHLHRRVKGAVAGYQQGVAQHYWTCSVSGCDWAVVE